MSVFGSSGIRGVANEDVTPASVMGLARAAGPVLGGERVALARDTRSTGRMLADAAASGLAAIGFDVDRLGVVPTPALQAYCDVEGVAGVMITASHNPPAYNGVKLVGSDGVELDRSALDRIEERLAASSAEHAAWPDVGRTRTVDSAGRRYVEGVVAAIDREPIADADLTVVVDPGHGAACATSPRFFRELGCTVHTVNAQADPTFPDRDPEPIAENLGDLRAHVESTGADLGVAHDGDADRATFVDETGTSLNGDAVLAALVAAEIEPGDTVVSAANASQRLFGAVAEAGADLSVTRIGSTYIITRIRELLAEGERVPVAGESNGGIIFPGYRIARDGAYTAGRFLELVAELPASEVVAPYAGYHNARESVAYESAGERDAMVDAIEEMAREAVADLDRTDGFRLSYGDGWVLARQSGTEPVIRIYAEARTEARARELVEVFGEPIRRAREA